MVVSGKIASSPDAQELLYLKGSIESVLDRCRFYYLSDNSTPALDATIRSAILSKANDIASKGLRVVAMAYGFGSAESITPSSQPSPSSSGTLAEGDLVFAGFQAMLDPPRRGVADAIASLQMAGIQIVMITGDAEQTALSIARDLGLRMNNSIIHPPSSSSSSSSLTHSSSLSMSHHSACLTGKQLDLMSERQLQERVGSVAVFARVTPRHKMRIVKAFQSRGAVVGMTGDGGEYLSSF